MDHIHDFENGTDRIDVSSFGFTSMDDFDVSAQGRNHTFLDFGAGDGVLVDAGIWQLDDSDFIFA